MDQPEFKIRTIPRKDEVRRSARRWPKLPRRILIASATLVLGVVGVGLLIPRPSPSTKRDLSSSQPAKDPMTTRLNAYVQDVKLKEEILRQRQQLENLRTRGAAADLDLTATAPEPNRGLGVTLDSENTADRLYRELNDRPTLNVDNLPENRINARLEKNKWVNELDRQERVQYVRNFVREAFEKGYEVELDQNLVVTGVHPITDRRVSVDQAIERISKQGY